MKEIIVEVNPESVRVALLENKELAEFYIEWKGKERIVGNIYKGRVANVLPGMQAAFVDIGLEKNAFLYAGDILVDKSDFEFNGVFRGDENNLKHLSIRDLLKQGQEIMVQVLKEPIGTKGARVTTHITLPGRTLVLMPTVNYIGVSRRIENEAERNRLKELGEAIKPDNMGLIMRTVAEGKDVQDFKGDIDFLIKLWETIQQKEKMVSAPRLIHKDEDIIYRTVRDMFTDQIDKFIIDNWEQYQKVRELVGYISPELTERVEYFQQHYDIFDYYQVEPKIEKALNRKVWLKSGGYLVFDQTEALTSIDVNTGKYVGDINLQDTVYRTNMEAAQEIARQIRLRDIGGIIIIDFIDMEDAEHKESVLECLKQALKNDRTKTNVLGITGLGLVEMTRKKVRQRISSVLMKPCPYCHGNGRVYSEETMMMKVKKEISRIYNHTNAEAILVEVHPGVAAQILGEDGEGIKRLEKEFEKKIFIRSCDNFHVEQMKVRILEPTEDVAIACEDMSIES